MTFRRSGSGRRILSSESGFTLIELVASLAVAGILVTVAAIALSYFFSTFDEMNKISQLRTKAFDCLQNSIKHGIQMGPTTGTKEWFGISNADSVRFIGGPPTSGLATGIILYPGKSGASHQNDYVKIYWDGFKYVRGTYLYGTLQPSSPEYLFPLNKRNNDITVTNLRFKQVNQSDIPKVIQVDLQAKIRIRKNYYRFVNYSTKMAIHKL